MDILVVNNFGDTRSGGLAGPAGLFIILLMAIATVLLIRNMNKRLRRLPDSFDPPAAGGRPTGAPGSDDDLSRAESAADRGGADGNRPASSPSDAEVQVSDPRAAKGRTDPNG